ncbi:hypothetical protein UFOVP688_9 [uncultured Caudovirales phage]|jgi:hypothetical protein|uniref:Tail completion protein n=1 Tax=uncultured Caudovirales phage TaxID=2100421 RepID=A0A6J5NEM6_9CAUD|nr:hypothetical protein UFOVP688_9 [uncultured Caudovirales phage]
MASISSIRTGLATRLATITGLRTAATIPDNPNPPIAIVIPDSINFDDTFHRGMDTLNFKILVIVGRADERTAQNSIDGFCATSGSSSVKAAIEGDKTLGGTAYDCRVTTMSNYGSVLIGEVTYLSCEFIVVVYA